MTIETYDRRSCDRCGFTVEVRKVERGEPKDWTQVTSRAFRRHVAREDGSTVDLCPDCHSSLIKWMALAMGRSGSTFADYGMRWDNSGRNGHYAPISWSN